MPKIDRRIIKSQEAIKKALIELMSEKGFDDITIQDISERANVNRGTIYLHYQDKYDLLDKIIEEHINKLRELCHSASDMTYKEGNSVWYDYFESHYLFFSTMLASKGAPYFRSRFHELVVEGFKGEADITAGRNKGLHEDVILQFFGSAVVGVLEWWFKNEMPLSGRQLAEQTGILLDRNL